VTTITSNYTDSVILTERKSPDSEEITQRVVVSNSRPDMNQEITIARQQLRIERIVTIKPITVILMRSPKTPRDPDGKAGSYEPRFRLISRIVVLNRHLQSKINRGVRRRGSHDQKIYHREHDESQHKRKIE
jgi:hypothetical protein